jgi:secreted trypsin-like serine protease
MKLKTIGVLIFLSALLPLQANAVENGVDATGSSFVVPISIDKGNGKSILCSGTLIAPSIAVTAGHCVLDANGLLAKNIYVGIAGSAYKSITASDLIRSVQITSTFQSASGGTVGDDDLAFITLGKPQPLRTPIILASEKQITDFKNRGLTLKSMGYGYYSNSGTEDTSFPQSFDGIFSQANSGYSNSAFLASTLATACGGDSGGPVLNISATQVTLVGVLTGISRGPNDRCGQKSTDGNYYSLFTLVGRYANLAFSAATEVMNLQDLENKSQSSKIYDLEVQLEVSTTEAGEVNSLLDEANATIAELRKQLPQTISCVKGKVTKKITDFKPKCPAGYKKK